MKIFLDTADVGQISSAYDTGLIDGVTTNPSIILKSGKDPIKVIQEIATQFPQLESISAEVVAETAEEMIEQAKVFKPFVNVTIKVPCTVEGLKACRKLVSDGFTVNVTLVFSVSQSILAAKAGATYISPFVGRWFDQSIDGICLIKDIRQVFNNYNFSTEILSASIRDVNQLQKCAIMGTDVATIPPIVFWSMYQNIMTLQGLQIFQRDWEEANNGL
jgi:transaldolase